MLPRRPTNLNERIDLLLSLSATVADYRTGELPPPSPQHIEKWVSQFESRVQVPILRELNHVLKTTYFSRASIEAFLREVVTRSDIVGARPNDFWKSAHFLDIQKNGNSQREMLTLFDRILKECHGLSISRCGRRDGAFVYLDDIIFSGDRAGQDLEAWIKDEAPTQATVYVIVIATHSGGEYSLNKRLNRVISMSGKAIDIKIRQKATIENRNSYKSTSEVLRPAELPNDAELNTYLALPHRFPFEPRSPRGQLGPFSTEQGREILEREMLLAGLKIRSYCANPSDKMRPLGYSSFGLGFGSMIVTFRNCPNNCPLALWWGEPEADPSHPFSRWYPLFPRKTYDKGEGFDDFS
jgi:hypothetical protein